MHMRVSTMMWRMIDCLFFVFLVGKNQWMKICREREKKTRRKSHIIYDEKFVIFSIEFFYFFPIIQTNKWKNYSIPILLNDETESDDDNNPSVRNNDFFSFQHPIGNKLLILIDFISLKEFSSSDDKNETTIVLSETHTQREFILGKKFFP